jgi:hypothetical protein
MFQCLNIFGSKQQGFTNSVPDEIIVKLRVPAVYHRKAVPPSIVVMELLWQQYGLDVLHPEVNRWLDRNAPDVSAATKNHFVNGCDTLRFKVGPQGTIELPLPLKVDDRLRDVSFQYILSQISKEPGTEPQLAA